MNENVFSILLAVLAGGIFNQVFTTIFGDRILFKRDFTKWRRIEKYNTYAEFLETVASSLPDCGYEKWPSRIRFLSQKIYLLHKGGLPPQALCDLLEELFQLTVLAKNEKITKDELSRLLRVKASKLRRLFAQSIEKDA